MPEPEILTILSEIRQSLKRLQDDVNQIKKVVVTEAELEEEELELTRELEEVKPDDKAAKEMRYQEETLDEVEKELGE